MSGGAPQLWEQLKLGFPAPPQTSPHPESSSCYICFDEGEDPSSLAMRCVRLKGFLRPETHLVSRRAQDFAILISAGLLSSRVSSLDILGGFLFRLPQHVVIIPGLEDLEVLRTEIRTRIDDLIISPSELIDRVFGDSESVTAYLKASLRLCLLRDILHIHLADKRFIPDFLKADLFELSLDASHSSIQKLNERLLELKPNYDFESIRDEWEAHVEKLYNRSPPRSLRKRHTGTGGVRKSLRRRQTSTRSSAEETEDHGPMEDEVKLVVDNWLQCDNCSKWRIVDSTILSQFEDVFFSCSNVGKHCNDPGDDQK